MKCYNLIEMAAVFAYLFYFIAASANPLRRRWLAVRHVGGGQIDFAFRVTFIVAILGTIILPQIKPFKITGNVIQLAVLVLICGVMGALFFSSNYYAQKHVDAGLTTVIINIYTPVTIVIASLTLRESLRLTQLLGTVLLLVAMVLVSKKHRVGRFRFDKYFWIMILSGLALGLVLSAERALMKITGFSAGVLMSWWAQTIGLAIGAVIFKSHVNYSKKDILITGGLTFLQALSWVLLLLVIGNLSVVSAVTTFKVVVIFVAAAFFLKEREDLPRKIVGSLIAVAGLLLMK